VELLSYFLSACFNFKYVWGIQLLSLPIAQLNEQTLQELDKDPVNITLKESNGRIALKYSYEPGQRSKCHFIPHLARMQSHARTN